MLDRDTAWDFGDLVIDTGAWEVRLHGVPVDLTKTEFQILVTLASRPRRVVTNEDLTSLLWGEHWYGDDGNIAVHMSKLRHKLGESGLEQRHIRTIRGVGYRFEPHPGRDDAEWAESPAFNAMRSRAGAVEVQTDAQLRVTAIWPPDVPVLGWEPADLRGRYFPVSDDPTWMQQESALDALHVLIVSGVREWTARHRVRRADGSVGHADFVTRIEVDGDGHLSELRFAFVELHDLGPGGGGLTALLA